MPADRHVFAVRRRRRQFANQFRRARFDSLLQPGGSVPRTTVSGIRQLAHLIPAKDVRLHAVKHGLATELAEASVSLTMLQSQLRHADVRTTLRVYSHVIPHTQREAMEQLGSPIGTVNGGVLKFARK